MLFGLFITRTMFIEYSKYFLKKIMGCSFFQKMGRKIAKKYMQCWGMLNSDVFPSDFLLLKNKIMFISFCFTLKLLFRKLRFG